MKAKDPKLSALAAEMGRARMAKMSPRQLKKHQQAAVASRWKKYRAAKKALDKLPAVE